MSQSINIIITRIVEILTEKQILNVKQMIAMINPITIPVHLAVSGN